MLRKLCRLLHAGLLTLGHLQQWAAMGVDHGTDRLNANSEVAWRPGWLVGWQSQAYDLPWVWGNTRAKFLHQGDDPLLLPPLLSCSRTRLPAATAVAQHHHEAESSTAVNAALGSGLTCWRGLGTPRPPGKRSDSVVSPAACLLGLASVHGVCRWVLSSACTVCT